MTCRPLFVWLLAGCVGETGAKGPSDTGTSVDSDGHTGEVDSDTGGDDTAGEDDTSGGDDTTEPVDTGFPGGYPQGVWLDEAAIELQGTSDRMRLGSEITPAGDVNGDGVEDLFTGVIEDLGDGCFGGYLFLGPLDTTRTAEASDAQLMSYNGSYCLGQLTKGFGDLDEDGYDDLGLVLKGVYVESSGGYGMLHIVDGPISGEIALEDYQRVSGAYDSSFAVLSAAGDPEGDGSDGFWLADGVYDELFYYNGPGPVGTPAEYGTEVQAWVDATDTERGRFISEFVADTDLTEDGVEDLLVGLAVSTSEATENRSACIVPGPLSGEVVLDDVAVGCVTYPSSGFSSLQVVGDVAGTGGPNIVAGASGTEVDGLDVGAAYVFATPVVGTRAMTDANAIVYGEREDDYLGINATGLGGDDADALVLTSKRDPVVFLGPLAGTTTTSEADLIYVNRSDVSGSWELVSGQCNIDSHLADDLIVSGLTATVDGIERAGLVFVISHPLEGL